MGTRQRGAQGKQLEKVIYFAAHMVTFVDVDKRHLDLAELRQGLSEEMLEIAEREVKALDNKLKEIEAEHSSSKPTAPKSPNFAPPAGHREGTRRVRSRFAEERELAKQPSTPSKDSTAARSSRTKCCTRDGLPLRRVLRSGMGADAILQLIDRMDLDSEEKVMREMIDAKDGRKPLSAQRHAKFLKRLASCSPSTDVTTRAVD